MSCHGTPGNRAATSLACALTHTPSDDVSRRFHDLKREGQEENQPSTADIATWLDVQSMAVRMDESISAWRRERLLNRLEEAKAELLNGALPDGPTWYAWKNLRAACDDAHTLAWLTTSAGMEVPLSEATPDAIDDKLANLWEQIQRLNHTRVLQRRDVEYAQRNLGRYGLTAATIEQRRQSLADTEARIDGLIDETEPFEKEYARRGGWSRYFRVISSGEGHVHASRSCHSCYPTTVYVWLPTLSGKGEDEAVDEYGSEMCSHCFPSVISHPRYQSRGRVAEEAAQARAAERAARDAVKAAKAISSPDGSPLRVGQGRYPEMIRTEVTAQRTLIQRMVDLRSNLSEEERERRVAEHVAAGYGRPAAEYAEILKNNAEAIEADIAVLLTALAHKRGCTPEAVAAEIEPKVGAAVRRISRARGGR